MTIKAGHIKKTLKLIIINLISIDVRLKKHESQSKIWLLSLTRPKEELQLTK